MRARARTCCEEFTRLLDAEPGMKTLVGMRRARSLRVLGSLLYGMMARRVGRVILSKRGSRKKQNADDLERVLYAWLITEQEPALITRLSIIHTCWLNYTNSQTTQHQTHSFLQYSSRQTLGSLKSYQLMTFSLHYQRLRWS